MKNRVEELVQVVKDYIFPLAEPKDYDNICGFCDDILEEHIKTINYEKFLPEIGQILKNQVVIMGMLQDMQEELEEIPNIAETHKLLTETKKYGSSDNV